MRSAYHPAMSGYARERAQARIAELAGRGDDLVTFWHESTEVLKATVPHYWAPCWYTLDPASLLVTSHFHEGLAELPSEWMAQEYYEDDVNKLVDVARSEPGISTLHDATGGDPSSSPRLAREHDAGRRPGDDRRAAHAGRARVGCARPVSRAGPADVRP